MREKKRLHVFIFLCVYVCVFASVQCVYVQYSMNVTGQGRGGVSLTVLQ